VERHKGKSVSTASRFVWQEKKRALPFKSEQSFFSFSDRSKKKNNHYVPLYDKSRYTAPGENALSQYTRNFSFSRESRLFAWIHLLIRKVGAFLFK